MCNLATRLDLRAYLDDLVRILKCDGWIGKSSAFRRNLFSIRRQTNTKKAVISLAESKMTVTDCGARFHLMIRDRLF